MIFNRTANGRNVRCILLLGLLPPLAGCSEGFNDAKLLAAAQEAAGTADVRPIPRNRFTYIARLSDGSVWYYETMGKEAEVTTQVQLIQGVEK